MNKMITTVTTTVTTVVTNYLLYAGIAIVALIVFLGLKEIMDLNTVKMRRHHYKHFLSLSNIVISALFIVFMFLMVYKIADLF